MDAGAADVRALEGIARALQTGTEQHLGAFTHTRTVDTGKVESLSAHRTLQLVNASNPARSMDKASRD